jgi:hypothetical protein
MNATIHVWDTETGREIRVFKIAKEASVVSLNLSSDGNYVLVAYGTNRGAGRDLKQTLELWDTEHEKEQGRLIWPAAWGYLHSLSQDSRRVLTASNDGTLRLWSTETREELRVFNSPQLDSMAFSGDGRYAVANTVTDLWIWELPAPLENQVSIPESPGEGSGNAHPGKSKPGTPAPKKKSVPPESKLQYLSDMDEVDVEASKGRFAKKGNMGYKAGDPPSGRILVNGEESPNGISMHPNGYSDAWATYKLDRAAKTFLASVALNDSAGAVGGRPGRGKIPTQLTFQVLGNDKVLWQSKPVDTARNVQECKVDVTGVRILELRVSCPGPAINAQAVWLEPRVLLK